MNKRHYIPAASIAFFSDDPKMPRRDSRVHVVRRGSPTSFTQKAENVGWMRGIYGDGKSTWFDHDEYFKAFEKLNSIDLDEMLRTSDPTRSANDWIKLSLYIGSLLTRNPDTELRSDILKQWPNSSVGYPLDMQRIAGAVFRTRWLLLHSPAEEFILSDRGFCGWAPPFWDGPALHVPIRRDVAIEIGGGARFQKQMIWDGANWEIDVPAIEVTSDITSKLNALTYIGSRSECYASTSEVLNRAATYHQQVPKPVVDLAEGYDYVLTALGSTLDERRADEMLMSQLWNGVRTPGDNDPQLLFI